MEQETALGAPVKTTSSKDLSGAPETGATPGRLTEHVASVFRCCGLGDEILGGGQGGGDLYVGLDAGALPVGVGDGVMPRKVAAHRGTTIGRGQRGLASLFS